METVAKSYFLTEMIFICVFILYFLTYAFMFYALFGKRILFSSIKCYRKINESLFSYTEKKIVFARADV